MVDELLDNVVKIIFSSCQFLVISLSLSDFQISVLQLEETSSRPCAASLVDSKIKNKVLRRYSSIGEDSLETMMKLVKHLGDPIGKLISHNESIVAASLDNLKHSLPPKPV